MSSLHASHEVTLALFEKNNLGQCCAVAWHDRDRWPQWLNDAALAPVLERAFSKGKPAAVAISVNSPGGSPVQSSLIGSRIRRLSEEKEIPVFAFVEDVAASGGYWLASCADEIFADPASIVGSIGVISAGFGLQDLIARYGIERRVYTAGKSKSMLDPFREEKQEDVERLTSILGDVHDVFIQHVKRRAAIRLPKILMSLLAKFGWLNGRKNWV